MYTNIAGYHFVALSDLKSLRERLLAVCGAGLLKGTILLSEEGINLFVAGAEASISDLLGTLRGIPGLENLAPKFSASASQPFRRMVVRIKKEIIAFGVEGIAPARKTSPKLAPAILKQWLDEGREITLLDTRNDYEVKLGTFRGATTLGIGNFRQFPGAIHSLPQELKNQPIVMFCTGGIRCEKAGPYMEREGFRSVFQLDGGILKYFEECGGTHYDGECFVFDQRVGVDPALQETNSAQCFVCQTPLTSADQLDPRYVPSVSCPTCYKSPATQMAERVAARTAAIARATDPLPGALPYENRRPLTVSAASAGQTLRAFLCAIFAHVPEAFWDEACEQGRFVDAEGMRLDSTMTLRAGQRFFQIQAVASEPAVNPDVRILHEDEAIVVLQKPAPLPMHPCGRFNRNTLLGVLDMVYAPMKLRPAHRLDANTTGLVVCARTRHFARLLQPQFENGLVKKTYIAEVVGHLEQNAFTSEAPVSTSPGVLGTRAVDDAHGLPARTDFTVLERTAHGTTLVEARPQSGRTNQIRIHLWQIGHPVCGDPAYLPGLQVGSVMTLSPGDAPMRLHASKLVFIHPIIQDEVQFEAHSPVWL